MNALRMGSDRISKLPDSLLTYILSYLPTEDYFKTSVFSKRWEFLWLHVSGLNLNILDFDPRYGEALVSLTNRLLEFNRGSCLQKFKIKYDRFEKFVKPTWRDRVVEWIAEVVHRGVQHLDVSVECGLLDYMPNCVYVSKTLVSLKLVTVTFDFKDPKFVVSLPSLKIMHLENNWYSYGNGVYCKNYMSDDGLSILEKLISGSPVLENITILEEFTHYAPDCFRTNFFGTNLPLCLSSTLEYVKINKKIMKGETGIKLVNYFLENSAVLKKLALSCKDFHNTNQEEESYMKLLTSTKLSHRCRIFVCCQKHCH